MLACVKKCVDLKAAPFSEKERECLDEQLEYFRGRLELPN
jgi:hypothetical protein